MKNQKYTDRIISDTGFESTHIMKVDQNRLKDFFSVDCTWFWHSEPNQIVDGTRHLSTQPSGRSWDRPPMRV